MFAIEILARTIYGEARGEPFEGKIAVGHVILNRVKKGGWWGDSIARVCLKDKQFSCWNQADPNWRVLVEIDDRDRLFRECKAAAYGVVGRTFTDETKGATHYHTKTVSPTWSEGREPCVVIGNHKFFNNVS